KEDCEKYEDAVNGVDIQVLGIGQNGHIGFNEPGTPFDEPTHIVDLTENTREANARFFDNDINKVPTQAITQGIGTIMKAKKILLVANGANKADALKAMIEGDVNIECPASVLQKHPDVIVFIDKEAASKLSK
ncbi:glucosamine-6-phosphate deaminase, partial [Dubosiella newyorkensis]